MKYTNEETVNEVLKRSSKVRKEREKRAERVLAGAGTALLAALIAVIAFLPRAGEGAQAVGTVYGSFLLGREAGGYVLAAVIAFVLGIVVTLLLIKRRNHEQKRQE
ncbi:MAG: hypothetical protein K6G81_05975 [Lachnospiraceae bacterium]|nr:hypothetical protein [Lachnospiraceae bacterium]